MTGCTEGRVPSTSLPEALESGDTIKAVDIQRMYPIYGSVISIDFSRETFDIRISHKHDQIMTLNIKEYPIFEMKTLDVNVPAKTGSSIICDKEIFTVVNEEIMPVWVGNHNFVYYPEDIQSLIKRYGYSVLMS